MPYAYTDGQPDLKRALADLDPRHCTRAPRMAVKAEHMTLDGAAFEGAVEVHSEASEEHGSINTYYRLRSPAEANCTVLPVTDPRIEWRYDDSSSRQSARPYIKGLVHGTTESGKRAVDAKRKHVRTQHSVPARLVPQHEGDTVPPGDPIALWNRLKWAGLDDAALVGVLCGGDVCVYSY